MKRIISMILAVILTVTSLPINLFAEDSYTLTPEQIAELVAGSEIAPIISEDVPADSGDSVAIADDTISDVSEVVVGDSAPSTPNDDADIVIDDGAEQDDTILPEFPVEDTTIGEADCEDEIIENIGDEVVGDEIITETYSAPTYLAASITASGTCGDCLTWVLTDDGILTISGTGAMYNYYSDTTPWHSNIESIKSVIIEPGVTSIGDDVFRECTSLTSINIPDSVTSIGYYAFFACSSLTSISIPDGVTSIGMCAFCYCSSLTSINIPDGVTSIGGSAFSGCSSLTSITIPDGVTSIGDWAFSGCTSLTSITIPDSITSIGGHAFDSCTRLTSITIPDSVTSIGERAFRGCSSLTSINIPDGVTSIDYEVFRGCSSLTSITIPDSVTSIGDCAFYDCSKLTSIDIPDSVTSIGMCAFYGCSSLTSINIPNGVTSIGSSTFHYCSSLTSISIPDSVTSIGEWAFFYCSSLTSINIPDGVTSIGGWAFYNCKSLTSITIPDSVTSIGYGAFSGCSSLTSITIPDSVTSIGERAFSDCSSLTSITVSNDNEFYCDLDGVLFNKSLTELICYPNGRLSDAYAIPDNVTSIGEHAFAYCFNLTHITISDSVTNIDDSAFFCCTNLKNISINNNLTTIGDAAFSQCSSLESIIIPEKVENIGWGVFSGCSNLTSVTIPSGVISIGDYAFSGCTSLSSIIISKSVINIGYESFCNTGITSIIIPENVASIGDRALTGCSSLAFVAILNPETVIYDSSSTITSYFIYGHAGSTAEEYAKKYNCNFKLLCDGFNHAYGDWSNCDDTYHARYCQDYFCKADGYEQFSDHNWVENEVPSQPTCSKDGEMYYRCADCTATKTEPIPATGEHSFGRWVPLNENEHIRYCSNCVTDSTESHIYDNEFDHICNTCAHYADVEGLIAHGTCGEGLFWELDTDGVLLILGEGAMTDFEWATKAPWFDYADEIIYARVQDGVTSIGVYAFLNCSSLLEVDIPDSVISIGRSAFANCYNLACIKLSNNLISIGNEAFRHCTSFTQISIPENVEVIGGYAFDNCTNIVDATINSKTLITGGHTFSDCTSLKTVTINGENIVLGSYAFYGCTNLESIALKGVTTIGEYAFYNCSSLTSVIIESATSIGDRAFQSCENLESITLPDNLISIGDYAFTGCSHLTEIDIPDSVESIGDSAFSTCTRLSTVSLSDNLKELGDYVFKMSGVKSIVIPAGVTTIGDSLFHSSGKLTSVEILGDVTSIGNNAFRDCTNLKTINIPDTVESIGEYAFSNCNNLSSIDIPEGVTEIGAYAFDDCYRWSEITIPSSVMSIGQNAFSSVRKVTILSTDVEIYDDSWTFLSAAIYGYTGSTAQTYAEKYNKRFVALDAPRPSDDCIMSGYCGDGIIWILKYDGELTISGTGEMEDFNWSPWYDYLDSIIAVTISDGITNVGSNAFSGCRNLTRVSLPTTVTKIGEDAFSGCTSLTQIEIPAFVTNIAANAFSNCTGLTSIVIPESVTNIGEGAFSWCELSRITFLNSNVEITASTAMITYNGKVLGYTGSTAQTFAENNGYSFVALDSKTILASGTCEDGFTWELTEGGILTVRGTGNMSSSPSWSSYKSNIYSVVISEGVTGIGERAFWYCSNISNVTFPSTLIEIGKQAFVGCSGFSSINIPEGVEIIEEGAFAECKNLQKIYIPKSVTQIGDGAFKFCSKLLSFDVDDANAYYTDVDGILFSIDMASLVSYPAGKLGTDYVIPASVTDIRPYAFTGTNYLININLSDSLTIIGREAFFKCYNLSEIEIPKNVKTIDARAFSDCYKLEKVIIPEGVTSIGDGAFTACESIINISLPDTLTSIGKAAFSNCTGLKNITIPENVTSIGRYAFSSCDNLESITFLPLIISIYNESNTISEAAIIYGHSDASAHSYAIRFGREFIATNDDSDEIPSEVITQSGTCGENLKWIYTLAGRLIISGTGEMDDYGLIIADGSYDYVMAPWSTSAVAIVINEGVTKIGNNAFMSMLDVVSISIPASLSTIANSSLPVNVSTIIVAEDSEHFAVQDNILFTKDFSEIVLYPASKIEKSYSVPDTVHTIRSGSFPNMMQLEYLYIPASVTKISSIQGDKLKSIIVDKNSEYYCDVNGVLYNKQLTEFVAFPSASIITDFKFLPTVEKMSNSISNAKNLINITFPERLEFYSGIHGCQNLETIYLLSQSTQIFGYLSIEQEATIYCHEDSAVHTAVKDRVQSIEFLTDEYKAPEISEYLEVFLGTVQYPNDENVEYLYLPLGRRVGTGDTITVHLVGSSSGRVIMGIGWDWNSRVTIEDSEIDSTYEIVVLDESQYDSISFIKHFEDEALSDFNITHCCAFFGSLEEYDELYDLINVNIIARGTTSDGGEWELDKEGTLSISGSGEVMQEEIATVTYTIDAGGVLNSDDLPSYFKLMLPNMQSIVEGLTDYTVTVNGCNIQEENGEYLIYFDTGELQNVKNVIPPLSENNSNIIIVIEGKVVESPQLYYAMRTVTTDCSLVFFSEDDTQIAAIDSSANGATPEIEYAVVSPWNNGADMIKSVEIGGDVAYISQNLFADCKNLESITFHNTDTEIYDSADTIFDTAVIYGYAGSTAEAYAIKYGRKFVDMSVKAGDMSGDGTVDKNDAIYLLYSVLFGDSQYPLNQTCDFNDDGSVDKNDAIYLLYHALFGEENYPLN